MIHLSSAECISYKRNVRRPKNEADCISAPTTSPPSSQSSPAVVRPLRSHDKWKVGRDRSVGMTRYGLDGPGIESRWGARFPAPIQTGLEDHPASYTMGTGYIPGEKRRGRDVDHPPHLAPRLKKSRAVPLLRLWAFVACYRVNFIFTLDRRK